MRQRKILGLLTGVITTVASIYLISLSQYLGWLIYILRNTDHQYDVLERLTNVWPYHQLMEIIIPIHIVSFAVGYLAYRTVCSDTEIKEFVRSNYTPILTILLSVFILLIGISIEGCYGLYTGMDVLLNGFMTKYITIEPMIPLLSSSVASIVSVYLLRRNADQLSDPIDD